MRGASRRARQWLGHWSAPVSAEGERVGLDAGIEKLDLERVVGDRAALPDQLVEPLSGHDALAVGIDIGAVAVAGRRAVDGDAEPHRLAVRPGPEHQMQVARVEAVDDAAALLVEDGVLRADRPVARQPPFVEPRRRQPRRRGARPRRRRRARRNSPRARSRHRSPATRHRSCPERPRRPAAFTATRSAETSVLPASASSCWITRSDFVVVAFAEMVVADVALGIDEIMRRPVLVVEGAPDRIVVVDRDRIVDLEIGDGLAHVVDVLLEGELRRVHADHDQALVLVLLGPGADVGNRAQAVDAGVGPEIDQHDLALEALRRQRRRVQPLDRAGEWRQRALDRQVVGLVRRLALHHHGGTAHHRPGLAHHHRRTAVHDHGRRRAASAPSGSRLEPVEQALLERRRAGQRDAGQEAGVEAQGDRDDRGQHRDAEAAPDPFADPERALHGGEDPPADEQRQRERRGGAGGIGEQQQRGARRWRPAAPRRSGSGRGPGRRRAPRAGRSRRRAAAMAARSRPAFGGVLFGGSGQPRAERDERPRQRSARPGNSSVRPNSASSTSAATRPYWLASTAQPPPTAASVATAAKVTAMPSEHRQPAAEERPVRPREHERQHRQDAGADDGQHAAEIGQQEQDHVQRAPRLRPSAGLNVSATPFMQ